ncbi:MAG: NAD(P)/FAD-dependent oxidoreductase, partial [Chloroflexota bacterium]
HRASGYPVDVLDRDALGALEPDIRLEGDEIVAAQFPAEGWVDATELVEALLARAAAMGAQVVTATVDALATGSGRVTEVGLRSGERLAADIVLLAAGPQTEGLAALAGVALPMAPTPGLLAITSPLSTSIRHVVHAGRVTLRPAGGGRLLLSSRAVDAELDPSTTTIDADAAPCRDLLARAARVVRGLDDARIEMARIGIRSVARDGLPVAGFAAELANLYLLVSHSGATLAPILGRLGAAELLGEPQAKLAPYRPDRFRGAA